MDQRLAELRATQPAVEIEVVDVLRHPLRAIEDRVMMIPLIVINDRRWYSVPTLSELQAALAETE